MCNNLVTIIIPVYNSALYLDACVLSAINQTYRNLEILLVDDGSSDNSGAMCDEWSKKDARIKVIHKENGGLSDARNAGLSSCKGDYVCFLDSDDMLDARFVEILKKALENSDCLLSECSYKNFSNDELIPSIEYKENFIKAIYGQHLKEEYTKGFFNESFCTKMFKKEIINKIQFPKGKIYEDSIINYKLFYEFKNVVNVCAEFYYYRCGNESIAKGKFHNRFLQLTGVLQSRVEFFKDKNEKELMLHTYGLLASHNLYLYYKAKRDKADKQVINEVKLLTKKYAKLCRTSNYISANLKKLLTLFNINPQLFYVAYRVREKFKKGAEI